MESTHKHEVKPIDWKDQSKGALWDSFNMLSPRVQMRNPVMFVVYIGSWLLLALFFHDLIARNGEALFTGVIDLWLWLTLIFANYGEALAERQGEAQASSLRQSRHEMVAKKLAKSERNAAYQEVPGASLRKGDVILVEAGDFIPTDGEAITGVAAVDESAITGESAPVIREGGGDRSAVTGGTRVISDWLIIKVTQEAGNTFLDKMISMVEGAARRKTPNEVALSILLVFLTLVFLVVTVTIYPFSW
ncbi:P-type ATPase, partial [Acidithiobacillus albertensis]|nr:potassium-transporting ATPase subunit B [Acidithiobacillus albertensis]